MYPPMSCCSCEIPPDLDQRFYCHYRYLIGLSIAHKGIASAIWPGWGPESSNHKSQLINWLINETKFVDLRTITMEKITGWNRPLYWPGIVRRSLSITNLSITNCQNSHEEGQTQTMHGKGDRYDIVPRPHVEEPIAKACQMIVQFQWILIPRLN